MSDATTCTLSPAIDRAIPSTLRVPSFFEPLDASQRETVFVDYVRHLDRRNGVADFAKHTFSKREEQMARLAASTARFRGRFDEALFRRQLAAYDRTVETPPLEKLLLVLCKVNAAEDYAVDVMRAARKLYEERSEAQYVVEHVALCEEQYHTRLLVGCAQYFGIDDVKWPETRPFLRLQIHAMANVPGKLFHAVLLAAEAVQLHIQHTLLEATRRLLRDEPEVRDAIQERIFQVMIDEIGHVTYNRYAAGPLGVRFARFLYPHVAQGLSIGPEYDQVRDSIENLMPVEHFDFGHLPAEVRRQAFFV